MSFIGLEQGGYEWGHSSSRNAISANIIQKMDLQVHLQQRFQMLIRLAQRVWICHRLRMCVLRFDWVVAKYCKVCCGEWCETIIEQVVGDHMNAYWDSMDTPCS